MRILLAIFCMFTVGFVVVAAMAIQLLVTLLPYLILAAIIWAIVRLLHRRSQRKAPAAAPTSPAVLPASHPRQGAAHPVTRRAVSQGGWVMVPMWFEPTPHRVHEVIDAEVIDEDGRRG